MHNLFPHSNQQVHFPICSTMVLAGTVLGRPALPALVTDIPRQVADLMDTTLNPCDDFYKHALAAGTRPRSFPMTS